MHRWSESPFPTAWMLAAACLAAGVALGGMSGRFVALWPLVLSLGVFYALFGYGYGWRGTGYGLLVLLGLVRAMAVEENRRARLEAIEQRHGRVEAVLKVTGEAIRRGDWLSFDAVEEGLRMRVVVEAKDRMPLPHAGEWWECAGWLERRPMADRRPRRLWIKGRAAWARRAGCLESPLSGRWLARLRAWLSRAIGVGVSGAAAARHRAMLLAERTALDFQDRRAFVGAGTMHVFAVSGLHVGVIATVILVVLVIMGVPLRLTGPLMAIVLWLYVAMIGFPASAVRAATMASFYYLAPTFWRKSIGLIAWAQTFLLLLVIRPGMVFEVGAQLSFVVMLGLLLFDRWSRCVNLPRGWRWVGFAAAAWLSGMPLAAHAFGRVTPGGLLANLAVVPLAELAVVCGALGALAGGVNGWLGAHFNQAAALFSGMMTDLSHFVASLPWANFECGEWSWVLCFEFYALLLLVFWLIADLIRHR